jgi:hypothetical protein
MFPYIGADNWQGPGVTWINVNGIHDVALIEELGKCLGLHPLTLEDIVNTGQRPKTEEFPGYIYVVLKMISFDEATSRTHIEHVSLIFGENHVGSSWRTRGTSSTRCANAQDRQGPHPLHESRLPRLRPDGCRGGQLFPGRRTHRVPHRGIGQPDPADPSPSPCRRCTVSNAIS